MCKSWKHWWLKAAMRVDFKFNGPKKLEKIIFNKIVAMNISVVVECIITNGSSADTVIPSDFIKNVS